MARLFKMTYLLLSLVLVHVGEAMAGGRYADHGDGTITDTERAIMWQKTDDGVERSWQEAISYCEALEFAGHKDWTLPTAAQLEGLIVTAYSPTIDPLFSVKPSYYWSATESTGSVNSAKYVNFYYGNTYTYSKDNPYYCLCVRSTTATPGKGLTAVFAGAPVAGKPLTIRFTPTITGGTEPYFYEWDFGDGSTAGATAPVHEFGKEGHYKVLLTVSDNDGAVSVANQEISLPLMDLPGAGPAGGSSSPSAATVPVLAAPEPARVGAADEVKANVAIAPADDGRPKEVPPKFDVSAQAKEGGGEPPRQLIAASQTPASLKSPRGGIMVDGSGQGAPFKGGALGHGLVSYSFANAMAGDGDWDKNGSVTASEIQAYLDQAIKSLSKGQQTPIITREGDDFPICASPGSTYVMAIGVGHDLSGASLVAGQDAELVRKAVEDKCPRTKTMMLTGTHANRQEILQSLIQIGSMITSDDTLLVYVGGANGVDNGRVNWYVDDSNKELPWFTGIFHDDLVQFVKTLPVNHIVVLGEKN